MAKSDVWSLGILTYYLCSQTLPFIIPANKADSPTVMYHVIKKKLEGNQLLLDFPTIYSDELKNLITNLLKFKPD